MACCCDVHIIVYFAEYSVTENDSSIVLICELDITKEDYSLSKRWSCSVYRLLGSGIHVRTYVGKLTISFLHFPECPFNFSADFVRWFYISCSIYTLYIHLYCAPSIIYESSCSYKAIKFEKKRGWAVSAEINKQVGA